MGIINRLGTVIKSYLSEEPQQRFNGGFTGGRRSADSDLNAAFAELNEYLNAENVSQSKSFTAKAYSRQENAYKDGTSRNNTFNTDAQKNAQQNSSAADLPPESLRCDFEKLRLPFGASEADCRAARKTLLKKHHPDVHSQHEGNRQKATANAAGINAAFQRIQEWYSGRSAGKK
ncbi:MAG: J domain-containing protein [Spirochaetaceae bacterium]|jgi:curved DNA-binding protein CbpA|nr:J domain-containing protein [Spirochaetaceae bacterium]